MSEERKSAAPQNGLEPKTDDNSDIEFILNDIGGTLSKFQIYNYASYLFSLTVAGVVIMSYVFSALNLEYRYISKRTVLLSNIILYFTAEIGKFLYGNIQLNIIFKMRNSGM